MNPIPLLVILAVSPSVGLTWTNPSDYVNRLEALRSFNGSHEGMRPALLWKDEARTIPKLPGGPGPDTAYMYVDPGPNNVLRACIRRCIDNNCSNWTYDVLAAVPTPAPTDTYFLQWTWGNIPKVFTNPVRPNARGLLVWKLSYADNFDVSIVTQEFVQFTCKPEICAAYGIWWWITYQGCP